MVTSLTAPQFGPSALRLAVMDNCELAIRRLLEAKVDVDDRSPKGLARAPLPRTPPPGEAAWLQSHFWPTTWWVASHYSPKRGGQAGLKDCMAPKLRAF